MLYLQQESEKNLTEKVEEAVLERDSLWNQKMAAQEAIHNEMLQSKVSSFSSVSVTKSSE